MNKKAQNAPLCSDELRAVSIEEIEEAERVLLEGLDYHLRCHHPYGAIKVLAADVTRYLSTLEGQYYKIDRNMRNCYSFESPRSIEGFVVEERISSVCERAIAIAQGALVYSDINFLFPPGQIAFATVAISLEGISYGGRLGSLMRGYLRDRFPKKPEEELRQFEMDVTSIICNLYSCEALDLNKFISGSSRCKRKLVQNRAAEINRVFAILANIRKRKGSDTFASSKKSDWKRVRTEDDYSSPRDCYKIARVTPNRTPH